MTTQFRDAVVPGPRPGNYDCVPQLLTPRPGT